MNEDPGLVDAAVNAANTLSGTQWGALVILLICTNLVSVWSMVRCWRKRAEIREQIYYELMMQKAHEETNS